MFYINCNAKQVRKMGFNTERKNFHFFIVKQKWHVLIVRIFTQKPVWNYASFWNKNRSENTLKNIYLAKRLEQLQEVSTCSRTVRCRSIGLSVFHVRDYIFCSLSPCDHMDIYLYNCTCVYNTYTYIFNSYICIYIIYIYFFLNSKEQVKLSAECVSLILIFSVKIQTKILRCFKIWLKDWKLQ